MSEPSATELVAAVAREHPQAHPYTLALLIQHQTGRVLTGQEVRRLLAAGRAQ